MSLCEQKMEICWINIDKLNKKEIIIYVKMNKIYEKLKDNITK